MKARVLCVALAILSTGLFAVASTVSAPHGPNGGVKNAGQGTLKVLASFETFWPGALIVGSNGQLYGAGDLNGSGNYGVIFSVDPSSGKITVLHTFDGGDGWKPLALLQGIDGNFYGVTEQGGGAGCNNGCGEVFEMDSSSPYTLNVLYQFSGGNQPYQPYYLVQDTGGMLYGLTYFGNDGSGAGGIFALNPTNDFFSVLHSFSGSDGSDPTALLPPYSGVLYGATNTGGPNGAGEIFAINSNGSGGLNIVHAFTGNNNNGTDGGNPVPLVQTSSGTLYGVATTGPPCCYQYPELFQVNPDGSDFAVLHSFAKDGSEGLCTFPGPSCTLANIDSVLLGTANGGGAGSVGTIFEFDPANSNFAVLYSFSTGNKGPFAPSLPLVQEQNDGPIYGATNVGGAYGYGAAFQFTLPHQGPQIIGVNNTVQLDNVSVSNSGSCNYALGSNCFSIQQNFWISTPTKSPAYWGQNIVWVSQLIPDGVWFVASAYQLWDSDRNLLRCKPGHVDKKTNTCVSHFPPPWALIVFPSQIELLSEIVRVKGADNLKLDTYLGGVPLQLFTVSGVLPSQSYVLAALNESQAEELEPYLEPELATVGETNSEVATFSEPTSGTVTSRIKYSGQSWQPPGTVVPSVYDYGYCIATGETAVNLSWTAPSDPSQPATFQWSTGGQQEGIIFFPAPGAYNYIFSKCD